MGNVKIPYYAVIKGRGYWQPTAKMRALGFKLVSCGKDGPDAWTVAKLWASKWEAVRTGREQPPTAHLDARVTRDQAESAIVWPPNTVGWAFTRYRKTSQWSAVKKPATRDDWWRGWMRIKPFFGDVRPSSIRFEQMDAWRVFVEEKHGLREAHRAMKIWRALWKVMAAMKLCERDADPSLGVRNSAAKGRADTWSHGEAVRLVKASWRMGHCGLAAALAVMWDTQMSPVDVRQLKRSQRRVDGFGGTFFVTAREKTETPVGAVLSRRATAILDAYMASLGFELHPDAEIFRTRAEPTGKAGGRPWPSRPFTKDKLAEDFREVRTAVFGAAENRKMSDMRRSGAVEAIAGDTTAEKLSRAMGNTLSNSNQLFETYAPIELAPLRDVAKARIKGRIKRRDGNA
ncbi:hypothetical protein [Chenggangzhangella methanolivorans]|uniref:Uncharacterized protein n=1 Tax=Chenggangzhangella methanolivorans TaxID=1437009 RepID=A0A9E6UN23_9HYPH|nr:hypothetical protein [Chenggangzhangella methanolivorans]QZN99748.1 hypothetical protein K6K41_24290 [Chenggangzhangella methanolivorans]